jgi:subtilisin-like proprotein convertase family protein
LLALAILTASVRAAPAQASVQLCIAMDGSGSINADDFLIMKNGLAAAIRDPAVMPSDGSVEISVVQFSKGTFSFGAVVEVPATVITDAGVAHSVADQINAIVQGGASTPTHDGISLCTAVIMGSPEFAAAARQVINIPTDGRPDDPDLAKTARDAAVAAGIDEIDAEAIGSAVDPESTGFLFLRDELVYPQPGYQAPPFTRGGFVISVATFDALPAAIAQKLQHVARPTRVSTATRTPTPQPTRSATATPTRSLTATATAVPASPTPSPGCAEYLSSDVPKAIPDLDSVSSGLNVPTLGAIADVDVIRLTGTHSFMGDLQFRLRSPAGTSVLIIDRVCGADDDFDLDLDDSAATAIPCPPTDRQPHVPSNPLLPFAGASAGGVWTLEVTDRAPADVGQLTRWGLRICVTATPRPSATSTPTRTPLPTATPARDCCVPHSTPACTSAQCTSCVCQLVPDCCARLWDELCVQVATNECALTCHCELPPPSATLTRTRTRTPTLTPTATPTPTIVDLIAHRLEVVQAVQDLNNSVRLVAGKRTFVRFHVRSAGGLYPASARLTAQRGANRITVAPLNPRGQIVVRPAPERSQLDQAFLFELPSGYREGIVGLVAELNPGRSPPEISYANNTAATSVFFEPVPEASLVIYRIGYQTGDAVYYPSDLDPAQMVVWMRRALPLSRIRVRLRTDFHARGLPTCGDVNTFLAAKRTWDLAYGGDVTETTRYYGMVADAGGFMRGCATDVPSFVASGPTGSARFSWDTDGSYGDWYGAHELGHAWGRWHAEFCGAPRGAPYPHRGGRISSSMTGDTALYGFDIVHRNLYGPNWHDVMTYCPYLWVSDFTTHGLMDFYQRAAATTGRQLVNQVDRLLVVGTIDPETNAVHLEPLFTLPSVGEIDAPVPGDYAIVLRAADGQELERHRFSPRRGEAGPPGPMPSSPERDVDVLFIHELVPFASGTATVDIEGPSGLLRRFSAGTSPPSVTLLTPGPGEVLDQPVVEVTWTGDDPDGDPLAFSLQYSSDDGATWEMVAQNLAGDRVQLDASNLAAGTTARFRIWVSDGVHTASDESGAPFTVPNRAPAVAITEPGADVTIAAGQTLTLEGEAYDIDTGTMADEQLQWLSSRDGFLGNGASLSLAGLSIGAHTITFRAEDGEGAAASADVQVEVVGDPSQLPPAPDELAVAPLLVTFEPALDARSALLSIDNRNATKPLAWEAAASAPWLRLSATSGTTPSQIAVSYRDPGLEPRSYGASITVHVPGRALPAQSVAVEVVVTAGTTRCAGDCDGDGMVTIDELVHSVGIVLGAAPVEECPAFSTGGDGRATIDGLIRAVDAALTGCAPGWKSETRKTGETEGRSTPADDGRDGR